MTIRQKLWNTTNYHHSWHIILFFNPKSVVINQEKLEMVQRRAARFVKSRYRRTDSVTAMLDELGWPILSKRRKDTRLILFYKTINNLAQVTHEHFLTKAYGGTRKKNNHKFRHIAVNTSQYIGSHFPPKLSVYGISCHSLIPLL